MNYIDKKTTREHYFKLLKLKIILIVRSGIMIQLSPKRYDVFSRLFFLLFTDIRLNVYKPLSAVSS